MTQKDMIETMCRGIVDPDRFRLDIISWLNHPITPRFMAMLGEAMDWHRNKVLTGIKTEDQRYLHNLNVHKGEVYADLMSLIDSMAGGAKKE